MNMTSPLGALMPQALPFDLVCRRPTWSLIQERELDMSET